MPVIPWSDFCEVARATPLVVKGSFGFGLKSIAKNLKGHGLTKTDWTDGPGDGLGAMVEGGIVTRSQGKQVNLCYLLIT